MPVNHTSMYTCNGEGPMHKWVCQKRPTLVSKETYTSVKREGPMHKWVFRYACECMYVCMHNKSHDNAPFERPILC